MSPEDIIKTLGESLGAELEVPEDFGAGEACAFVPPEQWRQACRLARDDDALAFNFLRTLCGVDRPEAETIEVVAHLFSYKHRHAIVLKTRANRHDAKIDSLAEVWPTAIWHERETYDLFGVEFAGNPDMRRILLPDDWVGHPLRKDYQEEPRYHDVPTSRPGYEKAAAGEKK